MISLSPGLAQRTPNNDNNNNNCFLFVSLALETELRIILSRLTFPSFLINCTSAAAAVNKMLTAAKMLQLTRYIDYKEGMSSANAI